MLQIFAGLFAVCQELLICVFTESVGIVKNMQPNPADEPVAKTVCGVQIGVLSLATRTFEGEKTTLANGFMSLSERMKPSDTSCGLDIAFLGNISRGTNYTFKVATLANWDKIITRCDEPKPMKIKQPVATDAKADGKGANTKTKDTRDLRTPRRRKYHYEGQPVGRECGVIITGGVNYMPHTHVDGLMLAGIANEAEVLHGVQISAWSNTASDGGGLQIGLLNNGGNMKGVQIGFLNCINHKRDDPSYLPFINAAW